MKKAKKKDSGHRIHYTEFEIRLTIRINPLPLPLIIYYFLGGLVGLCGRY